MGIRIQPEQFDVPDGDPFTNDTLSRRQPAEVLTCLIDSLDGPCVVAVDAAWGAGKSTFLKMWTQHLRKLDFPVVEFNAWETDFAADPFLALAEELTEEMSSYGVLPSHRMDDFKANTIEILRQSGPRLLGSVISTLLGSAAGDLAENTLASLAEGQQSDYRKTKQAIGKFRQTLYDLAKALSEKRKGHPLVVVIDELDRCRPSYAIEFLEVAKHLFAVDQIVFVLAINRAELAQSVRALYGVRFNAEGYLCRFFDLDFRLPTPNRDAFIDALLNKIRIDDFFTRTRDQNAQHERNYVRQWLLDYFGTPNLSLRTVEHALHRLGLLLASLGDDRRAFLLMATFVLILRTVDPDLYHRFADGEATDEEVADTIFARVADEYRQTVHGQTLEGCILAAAMETHGTLKGTSRATSMPLVRKYEALSKENNDKHATELMAWTQRWGYNLGYRHSVDRLELLSPDLLEKN